MKSIWPTSVSQNRREVSCSLRFLAFTEENHLRFSNSKHFCFYWTKKHFISEWYFTKNHEIGSLVVRKVNGRIASLDQLRLGVEEQLLIFSSCLSPGRVKKLQKFIKLCVKVGHSANLKHSKSTWRQSSCDSCKKYKISTSRNGNDLRQLSFWYRALSCGADWFTKGVYISVTNLHIAVPNLFLKLRVIHKLLNNCPIQQLWPTAHLDRYFLSCHTIIGWQGKGTSV